MPSQHLPPGRRLDVEGAVEHRPFDEVTRLASRRRRRRAGTAALTAAVATAVFLADPRPDLRPDPDPGPAFEVHDVGFVHPSTGFAVLGRCASTPCRTRPFLARTEDNGRTWQRLDSPLRELDADETSDVTALPGGFVSLYVRDRQYVSLDSGASWRPLAAPRNDGRTVEHVTVRQALTAYCVPNSSRCSYLLAALDLTTGVSRPLAHQPPAMAETTEVHSAWTGPSPLPTASRLWALGTVGDTAKHLAYSDDRGVSWRPAPLPDVADPRWFRPRILTSETSPRIYLSTLSHATGAPSGLWRLDDPTGEWVDLTAELARFPFSAEDLTVLPNGELRVVDALNEVWQTTDDGTRARPAPKARVDGAQINVDVRQIVDGMLVGVPFVGRRGDRVLFSADSGLTWQVREVTLP